MDVMVKISFAPASLKALATEKTASMVVAAANSGQQYELDGVGTYYDIPAFRTNITCLLYIFAR
jgi:hypothetical protein